MNRFRIEDLPISGLKRIERQKLEDTRGFFSRLFCAEELAAVGWSAPIAQINQSRTSRKGSVRGLHFQFPPVSEKKLVTCLRGAVWDVAVDLRRDSPTFLQWHGLHLTSANGFALMIPEGFAHGFQVIEPDSELLYLHSAPYTPSAEGGMRYDDSKLAITWPLPITEISERDASHPSISQEFQGVSV
jgi:dTDP-4-dehydrorhamnose 3,5-epimerase